MSEPHDFRKVEELYHAALARGLDQRDVFLKVACGADEGLLREVKSLLGYEEEAKRLLDEPALDFAARELAQDPARSLIGRRIRGYEVLALLGAGGMGEVYRARDTTLGREVALKLVPRELSGDPERLSRLDREARLLASLNHPAIATLYGLEEADGLRFLVMELVPGETLAARLSRGPLPTREALAVVRQMAEGLAAAHEKGIVHRDLKPANVVVTPDGRVKLLDFGLAKLRPVVDSPLETASGITEAGTVLGTVGYMSPEQVKGRPTDPPSDVFSFGAVFYEMVTGRRAFKGESAVETMNAILKEEPAWLGSASGALPPAVGRVVRRCLEKDPAKRFRSARELCVALEAVSDLSGAAASVSGVVLRTLFVAELVNRTEMITALGDGTATALLARADHAIDDAAASTGGEALSSTEGLTYLFARPIDAVMAAMQCHERIGELGRETGNPLLARVGLHLGEVVAGAEGGGAIRVEGMARAIVHRLTELAGGGQTLVTQGAFDLARRATVGAESGHSELRWLAHGAYRVKGFDEPIGVFEVGIDGHSPLRPPVAGAAGKRLAAAEDETTLGWRPAMGLEVPGRESFVLNQRLGEGGVGEVWLAEHRKTKEKRVFKFCFEAERLRGLKREVTLFRLLKETLGERDDIARVLDWSFDEAPFFIESEYTEGGSLKDWAEGKGGIGAIPLATRLELIAHVSEALGAAHSVGVLHKDIKPSNVLIAQQGGQPRARLADFGIGRVRDRSVLDGRGFTVTGFTELGTADSSGAGTPLYMAPELLEGKPPTTLADIYALGVMLYQVVTGDLDRALAPGWERDVGDDLLREDIAFCVEGRPERRLGNALRLAERLRGLDARRAERDAERRALDESRAAKRALESAQKRRRLAVAVASAATVFLAVVSLLAVRAERARQRAVAARAQADGLLSFMLGDLKGKLVSIRRLDLLKPVADKALDYYKGLPAEDVTHEAEGGRAQVLLYLAGLEFDLGKDRTASERPAREAVAILEKLAVGNPADVERRSELASARGQLGQWLYRAGDYDGALREIRLGLAVLDDLVKQDPGSVDLRSRLADLHEGLAENLFTQWEFTEALQHRRAARDILNTLAERDPGNDDLRAKLVANGTGLDKSLQSAGDLDGAERESRAILPLARDLASRISEAREALADALEGRPGAAFGLVGALEGKGDLEEALRYCREALGVRRRLADDPTDVTSQLKLAQSLAKQANVLRQLGRLDEAERLMAEATSRWKPGEGTNREKAYVHAWLLIRQGQLREARGDRAGARQLWRQSLGVARPFMIRGGGGLMPPVVALLLLGERDEARPLVEKMLARGLRRPDLLDLARQNGLLPDPLPSPTPSR